MSSDPQTPLAFGKEKRFEEFLVGWCSRFAVSNREMPTSKDSGPRRPRDTEIVTIASDEEDTFFNSKIKHELLNKTGAEWSAKVSQSSKAAVDKSPKAAVSKSSMSGANKVTALRSTASKLAPTYQAKQPVIHNLISSDDDDESSGTGSLLSPTAVENAKNIFRKHATSSRYQNVEGSASSASFSKHASNSKVASKSTSTIAVPPSRTLSVPAPSVTNRSSRSYPSSSGRIHSSPATSERMSISSGPTPKKVSYTSLNPTKESSVGPSRSSFGVASSGHAQSRSTSEIPVTLSKELKPRPSSSGLSKYKPWNVYATDRLQEPSSSHKPSSASKYPLSHAQESSRSVGQLRKDETAVPKTMAMENPALNTATNKPKDSRPQPQAVPKQLLARVDPSRTPLSLLSSTKTSKVTSTLYTDSQTRKRIIRDPPDSEEEDESSSEEDSESVEEEEEEVFVNRPSRKRVSSESEELSELDLSLEDLETGFSEIRKVKRRSDDLDIDMNLSSPDRSRGRLRNPKPGPVKVDTIKTARVSKLATAPDADQELLAFFKECEKETKEDHASTVRYALMEASTYVLPKDRFMDDSDVFASLVPPVLPSPIEKLPLGTRLVNMDVYSVQKKALSTTTKSSNRFLAKVIGSNVPRVPPYTDHTALRRNILVGDEESLSHIPIQNMINNRADADKNKFYKELEDAFEGKYIESTRLTEPMVLLKQYLPGWLLKLDSGLTENVLIRFALKNHAADLAIRPSVVHRILAFLPFETEPVDSAASIFAKAFKAHFGFTLAAVLLPEERLKALLDSSQKIERHTSEQESQHAEHLSTQTDFLCLICNVMCCPTHGEYNWHKVRAEDEEDSDTEIQQEKLEIHWERLTMPYEESVRIDTCRKNKPTRFRLIKPCSVDCYVSAGSMDSNWKWPEADTAEFQSMLVHLERDAQLSCTIAYVLQKPCWQVGQKIKSYKVEPKFLETTSQKTRTQQPVWYDNKRKELKPEWMNQTQAHLHQERQNADPCFHDGPCGQGCPCVDNDLPCEDICACPDDCSYKWTGCSCHAYGKSCASDQCICFQMNRECGSHCHDCGAVERIRPINKYNDQLFSTGCQNVALQRGVSKAVVMGESSLDLDIIGFGLFAAENIKKGEFLSEYAGEVISGQEAERRGMIYDRKMLSFLFDLNKEWCIDAARLGNKTRFINHADAPEKGLNLEAKILLVNGEHRIKFTALRAISRGEELFFNYGKKFAELHGLTGKKKGASSVPKTPKGGKKKGVVEGREALERLDGLDLEGRRGVEGRKSAGRGRKARKEIWKEVEETNDEGERIERDLVPTQRRKKQKKTTFAYELVLEDQSEGDDDEIQMAVKGRRVRRKTKRGEDEAVAEREESEEEAGQRASTRSRKRPARYSR